MPIRAHAEWAELQVCLQSILKIGDWVTASVSEIHDEGTLSFNLQTGQRTSRKVPPALLSARARHNHHERQILDLTLGYEKKVMPQGYVPLTSLAPSSSSPSPSSSLAAAASQLYAPSSLDLHPAALCPTVHTLKSRARASRVPRVSHHHPLTDLSGSFKSFNIHQQRQSTSHNV